MTDTAHLTIDTVDGRRAFAPGETVDVTVSWQAYERAEAIELRLVWYTHGKGATDVSVVQAERFEEPAPVDARRCRLALPTSPYSFSGKLISLAWAVELVVLPNGPSTRLDLVVAPEGREVELYPEG
jgi:hypothetical protein